MVENNLSVKKCFIVTLHYNHLADAFIHCYIIVISAIARCPGSQVFKANPKPGLPLHLASWLGWWCWFAKCYSSPNIALRQKKNLSLSHLAIEHCSNRVVKHPSRSTSNFREAAMFFWRAVMSSMLSSHVLVQCLCFCGLLEVSDNAPDSCRYLAYLT